MSLSPFPFSAAQEMVHVDYHILSEAVVEHEMQVVEPFVPEAAHRNSELEIGHMD
jgi:hypothetical protein